jgi:hypothetical protein
MATELDRLLGPPEEFDADLIDSSLREIGARMEAHRESMHQLSLKRLQKTRDLIVGLFGEA